MPRRSILSAAERDSLFALPETNEELIQHYAGLQTVWGSQCNSATCVSPESFWALTIRPSLHY
jgi:hypothetical protein